MQGIYRRCWVTLVLAALFASAGGADAKTRPRLGRAPAECPSAAPLPMSTPPAGWGRLLGTSPLWAFIYAHVDSLRARVIVQQDRFYRRATRGWPIKVLWVASREQTESISLSLKRLDTGASVWMHLGGLFDAWTKWPVLDPAHPGHPDDPDRPATHEWGSSVYFPEAGCYSLQVSWGEGAETLVFAFGR
jgi:hypothetical protein